MDLNDGLSPNEHADLRQRVVGGAKRMRAASARRSRIVAGAAASALVAVVVAGIAFTALRPDDRIATPVETSTPTPSATPSIAAPSPTPTPSETASTTAPPASPTTPRIAFDGDCSLMMSTEQWDLVMGNGSRTEDEMLTEWGLNPAPFLDFSPESTLGGLTCDRFAPVSGVPSAAEIQSLEVSVFPLSALSPALTELYQEAMCEGVYDGALCWKSAVDGEWWIVARAAGVTDSVPEQLLDSALSTVRQNLALSAPAHAGDRNEEWWSFDSCEGITQDMSLDDVLGSYVIGYWEGTASTEDQFFDVAGVRHHCPIVGENGESFVGGITLFPGAGWSWEQRTRGAEVLNVEGDIEAVIVRATDPAQTWVYATDGTNVAEISGGSAVERQTEMLRRLMPVLEQHRSTTNAR